MIMRSRCSGVSVTPLIGSRAYPTMSLSITSPVSSVSLSLRSAQEILQYVSFDARSVWNR